MIAILVQNMCSDYMSDSVRSVRTIEYVRIFCTYLRMQIHNVLTPNKMEIFGSHPPNNKGMKQC